MKKILSLFTALTLTASISSNLIACNNNKKMPKNMKNLDEWNSYEKSIFDQYLNQSIKFNLLKDIVRLNPEINNTNNHLLSWDLFNKKYLKTYIADALSKMSQINITDNDFHYSVSDYKTPGILPTGNFYINYGYNNKYSFWKGKITISIIGINNLKGNNTFINNIQYKDVDKNHLFNNADIYSSTVVNNECAITYVKSEDTKTDPQYLKTGLYYSVDLKSYKPLTLNVKWDISKYGHITYMKAISKNRILVFANGGIVGTDKQTPNLYTIIFNKDKPSTFENTPLIKNVNVNDIKVFDKYILVATDQGILFGDTTAPTLTLSKIISTNTQNINKLFYNNQNKKIYYSLKNGSNLQTISLTSLSVNSTISVFNCLYNLQPIQNINSVFFTRTKIGNLLKMYLGTKSGVYVSDTFPIGGMSFKKINSIPAEAWCISGIIEDQAKNLFIPTTKGIYYKDIISDDFKLIKNSDKIGSLDQLIRFAFNSKYKTMILTKTKGLWSIDQLANI